MIFNLEKQIQREKKKRHNISIKRKEKDNLMYFLMDYTTLCSSKFKFKDLVPSPLTEFFIHSYPNRRTT
uniref:Uncharacterized protein n=1 Tax=Rhizophora mucronata TaxID=61149 RepID=A0A2P2N123_RHIMU